MVRALSFVVLVVALGGAAHARILDRCAIANELGGNGFDDLPNWVCLVESESAGDTAALGQLNTDGSTDYGLFQINGRYWCTLGAAGGGCNIDCNNLLNDDITDDMACAKLIFGQSGFPAWVAWKRDCEGKPLPDISTC